MKPIRNMLYHPAMEWLDRRLGAADTPVEGLKWRVVASSGDLTLIGCWHFEGKREKCDLCQQQHNFKLF